MAWDSPDQYFDDFDDFDGHGDRIEEAGHITCRRCGETNLHWGETNNRWRLFNKNEYEHDCQLEQVSEGFHIVEEE